MLTVALAMQEAQATTDTSPSSPTKVASTKSVCARDYTMLLQPSSQLDRLR